MFASLPRLARDTRGSTVLEFAIVLPVALILLAAGIEFGLAQHSAGSMNYALQKGARALVLQPAMGQTALQAVVAAATHLNRIVGPISEGSSDASLSASAETRAAARAKAALPRQCGCWSRSISCCVRRINHG